MIKPSASPQISIVIPHYNQAEQLRRCLAALAEQIEALGVPAEVIVVDNGSRERPGFVDGLAPFIRLMDEPTPGPGPARNSGISAAKGVLIALIDADCLPGEGWLSTILKHFTQGDSADIIGGDVRILADQAQLTSIEAYESIYGYRFKLYIERDHYAGTGNMAFRRTVFDSVGPFAGLAIAEDADWGRRATAMGFRLAYVEAMRIYTPARESFDELARKWDRHIGHNFSELSSGLKPRVRWLARALLLAPSPLAEVWTILRSDRISGVGNRWRAWRCLAAIRGYRARKMLTMLSRAGRDTAHQAWRKS
jgi:glycosyltransferase involved in cell wall biosynthesis